MSERAYGFKSHPLRNIFFDLNCRQHKQLIQEQVSSIVGFVLVFAVETLLASESEMLNLLGIVSPLQMQMSCPVLLIHAFAFVPPV